MDWNASTTFVPGQVVRYNDDLWQCAAPSAGDVPTQSHKWQIAVGSLDAASAYLLMESRGAKTLNAMDYGADPNGARPSSAAFSAAWAALKALRTVASTSVPVTMLIPPGNYNIDTSINWTGGTSTFLAWNCHIIAPGAVFVGSCADKAVVDMIGVRGLHIHGLMIYGSTTSIPACGILYGPRNSETCGNNKFDNVKTSGYFSKAPAVNIGSETSQHLFCYYINENPAAGGYGYIADGLNRWAMTTDYSSIRAADAAVSFTNNRFIGCRFHKNTTGGSLWGEYLVGWQFDADCYFLAFTGGVNVTLRQSDAYRCSNLRLNGLFETTTGDGVDYALLVIQADAANTTIANSEFNFATPHAELATIKVAQLDGTSDLTTGVMRFDCCTIRQSGNQSGSSVPMWDGARIHFTGEIFCDVSTILNMDELLEFHGIIHTQDMDSGTLPAGNSTGLVFERTRDIKFIGLQDFANDGAAATGGIAVGGIYRNGSVLMIRVS